MENLNTKVYSPDELSIILYRDIVQKVFDYSESYKDKPYELGMFNDFLDQFLFFRTFLIKLGNRNPALRFDSYKIDYYCYKQLMVFLTFKGKEYGFHIATFDTSVSGYDHHIRYLPDKIQIESEKTLEKIFNL